MNGKNLVDVVFCSTCIFWEAKERDKQTQAPTGGICRRNPPTPIAIYGTNALGQPAMALQAHFPPTLPSEYCGEHDSGIEEDETAN